MANRPGCCACGREISREIKHESRTTIKDAFNNICPACLMEMVRGFPALKAKVALLETKIQRVSRGMPPWFR